MKSLIAVFLGTTILMISAEAKQTVASAEDSSVCGVLYKADASDKIVSDETTLAPTHIRSDETQILYAIDEDGQDQLKTADKLVLDKVCVKGAIVKEKGRHHIHSVTKIEAVR